MPTGKIRKLIGGILSRYQEIFGIELFAYNFLSNHLHLIARAPGQNIDEFCENVNREIAKRLNWKYRREGKFWSRRYDDQQILTANDLIEAFLYVTTNPSRHGLVRNSKDWTGLNSFEHSLKEQDRTFTFHHYSKEEGFKTTTHTLKLSILPPFQNISKKERKETIEKLLNERMDLIAKERSENNQGFLGIETILEQVPGEIPISVSRSRRPNCYTKDHSLRKQFRESMKLRRTRYAIASMRYRLKLKAHFPENTFFPPLHRAPRLFPFTPLTPDFFKNAA